MTIHELLALTGLTESDEIPVWDVEASGEPTKKITAQNFAAAIKTLASLLGTGDVVNDLTSTATDKPGSANMLKTLNDKLTSCLVGETLNVSGTTDAGGRITINKSKRFSGIAAVISNVSHDLSTPYSVTIEGIETTTITLRIRSLVDNSAIANTSVNFSVLLFGVEAS